MATTTSRTMLEESLKREMMNMLKNREAGLSPAFIPPAAPPKKDDEIKVKDNSHLKEGHKWASDVIGAKLAVDFPVRMFNPEDWNEKVRGFIPQPKKGYVIQIEAALDILRAWEQNDKILISGPTGAGKSSLLEHLCALVQRPFIRFNATGDMDSSMLFGQLVVQDGATVWVDGVVTEAVRYGAVCAWDEWELTSPEIAMGLQWLLEDEGKLFLKEMPGAASDKFIVPEDNFRLACLGNTLGGGDETGRHAGVNVQNSATVDRFGTAIRMNYMAAKDEIAMIVNVIDGMNDTAAGKLVKFASLIRQGYEANTLAYTLSPRALLAIAKKMTTWGMKPRQATEKVYFNKLNASQRRAAEQLFDKVYGS